MAIRSDARSSASPLLRRLATLRGVPTHVLVITGVVAVGGVLLGIVQGWPAWAMGLVFIAATAPVFTMETAWTWRHYGWLGLFYLLIITQGGHVIEHVAQVTQIHVLGTPKPEARGIISGLDVEWVHVTWNTWVLVAVVALTIRFRRNPWMWVGLAFAVWHETEHLYIMTQYLSTGLAGHPGLLSQGGVVSGGLPITRPDLHFYYNVVETTPLVIAFIAQLRTTYDAWLERAFPHLPAQKLTAATARAKVERYPAGQTIVAEGDVARTFHVITRGEVKVTREAPLRDVGVARLGPGQYFGEIGLLKHAPRTASVRALTATELLTFDREAFDELFASDEQTSSMVDQVLSERLANDAIN